MNKKHLARAHKFATGPLGIGSGSYVRYFPYQVEACVYTHGMSIGPKAGYITAVIRHPTQTDYGLFEVTWVHQVNQPTIEAVPGNRLCFST